MEPTIQMIRNELKDVYSPAETGELIKRIFHTLKGLSYTDLVLNKELSLSGPEKDTIGRIVQRLKHHEPVQYILGQTEFYGMTLKLNPSVLIPRPETEEMVHRMVTTLADPCGNILDIGTGSGCIALALKKSFKNSAVYGCDISRDALQVARENALLNELEVSFFQADILRWEEFDRWPETEIIVSNPPYVMEKEKSLMEAKVLDFEPPSSLFVPDEDPLLFYRSIIDFASKRLPDEGSLYLEINEQFPRETGNMLLTAGFSKIDLLTDMQNKPRMMKGILSKKS